MVNKRVVGVLIICESCHFGMGNVTTQDFVKFWGKFFVFDLLEIIGISQGFKTFESI
jgi:hypothetical protein